MNTSIITKIFNLNGGSYLETSPDIETEEEFVDPEINLITKSDSDYINQNKVTFESMVEATTDETEEFDFGTKVLSKAKSVKKYLLKDTDFINLSDKPNKNKILQVNSLDEFDEFTERYGGITELNDDTVIYIKWDKVQENYKGLYVNHGLYEDRYNTAYYEANVYNSWWKLEYHAKDTLIFTNIGEQIAQGSSINKPFKGTLHDKEDFHEDEDFTRDFNKSDKTKIFMIDDYDGFDEITKKYGGIYQTKSGKHYLRLNWNSFADDYKGFMIDSTSSLDRVKRAYYMEKKYISWVRAEKIKQDKIYIFE